MMLARFGHVYTAIANHAELCWYHAGTVSSGSLNTVLVPEFIQSALYAQTNPRKRYHFGDCGHRASNKRRAVLAAARKCRQAERGNAHPTGEQSPSAAETSVVTLVEASMATPSETSVPMPHQDQDRLQVLPIYGCRIVNVAELSKAIYELTAHSTSCEETCLLYSG